MGTLVIVCSVIAIINIGFIMVGLYRNNEVLVLISAMLFMSALFLGLGLFCNIIPVDEKTEIIIPTEIVKGKNTIYLKINGKTLESNNHELFINDEKNIRVKKITKYNSYGSEIDDHTSYDIISERQK